MHPPRRLSSALFRLAVIVINEVIMNKNSHPATALLLLLTLVLFGATSRAELPDDPKELLKLLKAKDSRFDNVHVYYIRRGEYTPEPFPYWKFPGLKPSHEPEKPLSFRFKEQVMLRGRDTTFERDVYTKPLLPSSSGTTFVSHQKWSNADGLISEFLESKEYDDRSMKIQTGESNRLWNFFGQRREIEFSLGFGFGSRIKTISSVTKKANQLLLEGSILLWDDDVSTFRLTVDQDLVVRSASIRVEAGGNQTRYDVSTEGSVKVQDFVFARTGHYTRTALGLKEPPPVKLDVPFKPHVTDEFYVDFKSAKFGLKDEEYTTFTKMEIPPGTHVTDLVRNKRYVAGQETQTKGGKPPLPRDRNR